MLVDAMQYRLHIPGYTIRLLINIRKGRFIYRPVLRCQQAIGKLPIHLLPDARQRQHQRTLEERTVCRQKHLLHQVLLTARKHEIYIRQELNIRTDHRLNPILDNLISAETHQWQCSIAFPIASNTQRFASNSPSLHSVSSLKKKKECLSIHLSSK